MPYDGSLNNPGLYWDHPDTDACVTWEGETLDAFGLYPLRNPALLLPALEAGDMATCDCEFAWGAYDPDPPEGYPGFGFGDPGEFANASDLARTLEGPGNTAAVTSNVEAIGYFDQFGCRADDTVNLTAGTTFEAAYELARVLVPEGALGVFENVETALNIETGGANAARLWFMASSEGQGGAPNNPDVNNTPCPWPASYGFGPGDLQIEINCEWVWIAQGIPSVNADAWPPLLFRADPRLIPPGIELGPGRWNDQRYAHKLPRYGAQQFLQRGPFLVRLFAIVTLTPAADDFTDVRVRPLGRLQGFVQRSGARLRSVDAAVVRRP